MDTKILNGLLHLPLNKQELAIKLRGIILSSSLEIKEALKYGRITFITDKGPVAFLCIMEDTNYIEVGFFKGVLLSDPKKLLKGKSREIRRIKIKTEKEIPVLQIKRWVREAVKLKNIKNQY